jgi:hypothetical protein
MIFETLKILEKRQGEMINFAKNVALLGGAMALMGVEELWPASVSIGQPTRMERARRFIERARATRWADDH